MKINKLALLFILLTTIATSVACNPLEDLLDLIAGDNGTEVIKLDVEVSVQETNSLTVIESYALKVGLSGPIQPATITAIKADGTESVIKIVDEGRMTNMYLDDVLVCFVQNNDQPNTGHKIGHDEVSCYLEEIEGEYFSYFTWHINFDKVIIADG